jgi:hypothetical protein
MKKLFTVLAVLLVASLAFAGFSGSVKAGYTFDFDVRDVEYTAPGFSKVDATFGWDSPVYTVGEAEGTHIEFALSTNFKGFYNLSGDHADGYDPFKISAEEWTWSYQFAGDKASDYGSAVAGISLSVDTFKIVGSNWEVSFVDKLALDFAKSAIDSKRFNKYTLEDNTQYYSMGNSLKGKHNLVATVAGYKFGFGLDALYADWTDELTFALTGVTPEYDFNGVKAQFGAGYEVSDKTYALAASAKASYATDKLAVSGAYDAKITENDAKENFVWNDLAVKFDFAPVTVDVYFANDGANVTDKYEDYFWKTDDMPSYVEKKHGDATSDSLDSNYLSTKVIVDVAKVAENVPVKVTLTGKNLINEKKQNVSVEAETTIVPNFKFGVYFKNWFAVNPTKVDGDARKLGATVEFTGVQNLTLNGEVAYRFTDEDNDAFKRLYLLVGASYAHELFTASASVAAEKLYEQDMILGAKAAVVSTSLVKGAELSAKAYFNLNNLQGLDEKYNATNMIDLACKVSF